jgi:hypothetical protein
MVCEQIGTLILSHNSKSIIIHNALYIPDAITLISVSQLTNNLDFLVLLSKESAELFKSHADVRHDDPFIKTGKQISDKLWKVALKEPAPYKGKDPCDHEKAVVGFTKMMAHMAKEWTADNLHAAYGHVTLPYLKKLFSHLKNVDKLKLCDACSSMQLRKGYSHKTKYDTNLELIERSKKKKYKVSYNAPIGPQLPPVPSEDPDPDIRTEAKDSSAGASTNLARCSRRPPRTSSNNAGCSWRSTT